MTIASTTSKVPYNGSGSTGPFSITFRFAKNADIVATKVSTAGVETVLTLTTHYTLTGAGNPSGGALTLVTALATGEKLVISRDPAIVQETDYVENAAFPAETHEAALDLLTMIAQANAEKISRAVLVPISSSTSPADLLDEIADDVASAAASAATATTQAGIATAAAVDAAEAAASVPDMDNVLLKAGNLAGLASATTSRTNLGLGDSAVLDVGVGGVQGYDADLAAIAALSPAQGDVLYHNGTAWTNLAAGTSGQFLKTLGAAANPAWGDIPASNEVRSVRSTRVLSAANGSVDYTIAGETRTPSFVQAVAVKNAGNGSNLLYTGSAYFGFAVDTSVIANTASNFILEDTSSAYQTATIALISGGVRLTYTKTGSPTATLDIFFILYF